MFKNALVYTEIDLLTIWYFVASSKPALIGRVVAGRESGIKS